MQLRQHFLGEQHHGAAADVAKRLYPDMDTRPWLERFLAREAERTGRSIDGLRLEAEAA